MVAIRHVAASLALAALLLAPATLASTTVPGIVHGTATASSFYVKSEATGYFVQGGAYETTQVCSRCFVRLTLVDSNMTVVQDGQQLILSPGEYELREFAGTIAKTKVGDRRWFFHLEGAADVHRVGS